ncbi:MAG: preprotein translocase subunit SecE [Clostridia bacterium]|nr:preprotein translocase subunit SecE [Clostridia bacterium]
MAENEKLEAKAAEKKPEKKKAKGPSVWARIAAWFRSVKAEMKKIVWESPKAVLYNTVMVLVALVVFAVVIGLLDAIFSKFIYILGILI